MTISRRITLFSTGMLAVLLLLVNGSIYFLFEHYLKESELHSAGQQARTIVEAIQPGGEGAAPPSQLIQAYVPNNGLLRIVDEANESTLITKHQELYELKSNFSGNERSSIVTFAEYTYVLAVIPMIWEDGSVVELQLAERLDTLEETLPLLRMILLIASLLIIIVAFLAGQTLSQIIVRPIQQLAATMNEIRQKGTFKKMKTSQSKKR